MVGGWEQHRAPLVAEILAHRDRDPGIARSNRDAWHSGEAFQRQPSEHVLWVLQHVHRFALGALGRYYDQWARHEPKLGAYWANVLPPGGWNAPHHHFPQHWSGTYYVSVGRVGGTPGDPSGMIEFLNPSPVQAAWHAGNFAVAPKDGMLVLFPSAIVHLVHAHANPEPRISLAYNLNIAAKPTP